MGKVSRSAISLQLCEKFSPCIALLLLIFFIISAVQPWPKQYCFSLFFLSLVVVKPVDCQWWIGVYYHKCYYVCKTCNQICRLL